MLHWYFSECVIFTGKRQVNSNQRKTMLKQYFLPNLELKGNGNQIVHQCSLRRYTSRTLIQEI
jgi:hypothetical protein